MHSRLMFTLLLAVGCKIPNTLNASHFELVNGPSDTRRILMQLDVAQGTSGSLTEAQLEAAREICLADLEGHFDLFGALPDGGFPADVRHETHLYLRDPNEVHDTLGSMTDDEIINGRWASELKSPQDRPLVVVIPFPPASPFTAPTLQIPLGAVYYPAFGSSPSAHFRQTHPQSYQCRPLVAEGASPAPLSVGAAIRGVALYDRGLCRSSTSLDGNIIPNLLATTWGRLSSTLQHSAGAQSMKRRYNLAAAYQRLDGFHPTGGLFWAFHFVANNETHFWGNFRLEHALDAASVPTVEVKEIAYHSTGGMAPTWGVWLRDGSPLNKPISVELAQGFTDSARDALALPATILGTPVDCTVDDSADTLAARCETAANEFALSLTGFFPSGLSDEQKKRLRCSVGETSSCVALGKDATSIRKNRWKCGQQEENSKKGLCNFVLPVKRLNPMPDQLELVFFDSTEEFDNAAFAASLNPVIRGRVCVNAPPPADLLNSTFKVLLRTPAASGVDIDPWPN